MIKYFITNGDFSICENSDGEYVIEADSKCNLPTSEFGTREDAEKVLKETEFDKWHIPGYVAKMDVNYEN